MSLRAYEDACTRAELFGQPLPNKEEFLEKHKHLDIVEFEEVEIRAAEDTAVLDEDIRHVKGGLNELNNILKSTQTKLNKLKGVCGTITNFFRPNTSAKDNLSYSTEQSYVGQSNFDKGSLPPLDAESSSINEGLSLKNEMSPRAGTSKIKDGVDDINTALDDIKTMQEYEETSLLKSAAKDIGSSITSQFSKLDQMINQADKAETSMKQQNKQLRGFIR